MVVDGLVRAGVPRSEAETIAASAVDADLGGRSSHGVVRIPVYLEKARRGGIDPRAGPAVVHDNGSVFAIDARDGFGQPALRLAVEMAVERARRTGIACGTVRRLNNAGALGWFARLATDAGQIAILAGNATPAMPAPGGRSPVLGTNPLCMAVPVTGGPAPVLDMATTASSKGSIRAALRRGVPIPSDWALSVKGAPTTDPKEALEGLLLPFGGAKGFGIALMVEILSGVLSGAGFGEGVRPLGHHDAPSNAGAVVITILPDAFMPRAEFDRRLGDLLRTIRGSTPGPGIERVRIPGDRYWSERERRLREGIEIPAELHRELLELAGRSA